MAKHQKPTRTKKIITGASVIAGTGAIAMGLSMVPANAFPGQAGLIKCESGGNPTIVNNTAAGQRAGRPAGLFQIVTGTWRANGGLQFAPTADKATPAQQQIVADRIYARSGARPWECKPGPGPAQWSHFGGGIGGSVPVPAHVAAPVARGPVVWPVQGKLTSGFGPRNDGFHAGIDLAAPIGTPIHSATSGVVINAGTARGFGLWVRVKAADGTITVYGHVHSYSVKVGQQVAAGQVIAAVGSRGASTGPHLHFEVIVHGVKVNPLTWLTAHGANKAAPAAPQAPAAKPRVTAPDPAPEPAPTPPGHSNTYTVKAGDTLWDIAAENLHNPNQWHAVYALNKSVVGEKPGHILPGQVLRLPGQ